LIERYNVALEILRVWQISLRELRLLVIPNPKYPGSHWRSSGKEPLVSCPERNVHHLSQNYIDVIVEAGQPIFPGKKKSPLVEMLWCCGCNVGLILFDRAEAAA
jgi:hypothetical protein